MLPVEERFMIKEQYKNGVSISEIARQTGNDRKTIRSIIQGPVVRQVKPREKKNSKLDGFRDYLDKRIQEGVLNGAKLYQELLQQGYRGKARTVRRYVQPYRSARQQQATVRYETAPGQQGQVDWGSFGLIEHQGRQRRLYGFVMTLGWSRAMYLEFTVCADIAWWLRCHLHAFHYFGGVPQEILHDNLKTAVLGRDGNGTIHWNPRYLDFAHYYGFSPRACRPYRAQTKGKVESGVRYVRGNFWNGLAFVDLPDLNQQARQWLDRIANLRIHGTTHEVPFTRLAQEPLQSLANKVDYDTSLISYRRSTKDCVVSYEGNAYSVPAAYAQQQLMLKVNEQDTLLILTPQGRELARHTLALTHNQRIVIREHYATLTAQPVLPQTAPARQTTARMPALVTQDAPVVEVRSLTEYQDWTEVWA